jgi:hypothetical protein
VRDGLCRERSAAGGYAVASRVKSLSNGFQAIRWWWRPRARALAFTRQYHWPVAIAVLDRSSVVVRFSTIPDSPISPFHGTLNMQLSPLGRALAPTDLTFCPMSERSVLLDMLTRSQEPEDKVATERKQTAFAPLQYLHRQRSPALIPVIVTDGQCFPVGAVIPSYLDRMCWLSGRSGPRDKPESGPHWKTGGPRVRVGACRPGSSCARTIGEDVVDQTVLVDIDWLTLPGGWLSLDFP